VKLLRLISLSAILPPKKDVSSIFGDDLCSIPMVKCLEKKGTLRRRLEFRKYIADFSTVYLLS
jgi:hypothetical protein